MEQTAVVDWRGTLGLGADFPRFVLLGGLLQKEIEEGSLLDVGCDTALLRRFVPDLEYTGLELSETAITEAAETHPECRFIQSSAEEWKADRLFDGVLFNESLYYLESVAVALAKYRRCVAPGGVLAVSIYRRGWRSPNRRALREARAFMGDKIVHDISLGCGALSWDLLIARY